jgi:cardiolipin synthase
MGALLDPVVDRLAVLSGAAVCWHFELLPRWALAVLAIREVATLVLAEVALRRGIDLEISWVGRISVFLVFGGIFWSMVVDWWIIEAGFVVGVAMGVLATYYYVRAALGRPPQAGVQPSSST